MNEIRYTPGPWSIYRLVDAPGGCPVVHLSCSNRGSVARVVVGANGSPGDEGDDLRLIAAAPDLLAACEAVLAEIERRPASQAGHLDTQALREAIAKARGERPVTR